MFASFASGAAADFDSTDTGVSNRNSAFGDYPTTSSPGRRCRRHGPCARIDPGRPCNFAAHRHNGAGEPAWRHALSLFGEIKYPADFKRFDYVNPEAPKGGTVRQIQIGTFDNFNLVVAGVKGSLAAGVQLIYESLMTQSLDEVSTEYGELAEAVSHPEDFSWVTYRLRREAKWHDGKPVTPDDVIFSLNAFKQNHPQYSAYYRHVVKAEKVGDRDIKFTFDAPGNRELPLIVGQLTILPKHWWEGTDSEGRKRDIAATTLEKPLGSGPYRIKEFVPGRTVTLERVKDHWGRDSSTQCRPQQFRRAAPGIFPGLDGRARGVQGRPGRLAHRKQRQELGNGLRLSRRQ